MRRTITTRGPSRGKNQVMEGRADFTESQIELAEGSPFQSIEVMRPGH